MSCILLPYSRNLEHMHVLRYDPNSITNAVYSLFLFLLPPHPTLPPFESNRVRFDTASASSSSSALNEPWKMGNSDREKGEKIHLLILAPPTFVESRNCETSREKMIFSPSSCGEDILFPRHEIHKCSLFRRPRQGCLLFRSGKFSVAAPAAFP